jgi:hypothetical protein
LLGAAPALLSGVDYQVRTVRLEWRTLEDEIANAPLISDKRPVVEAAQEPRTTHKAGEVPTLPGRVGGGIDLKAVWGRVGRWWRGRT